MSAAAFPKILDPMKMVDQRVDLQGKIALDQLERLQDILLESSGEVEVELHFGKDEEGIATVTGSIQAEVLLKCQRCLQPVSQKVVSEIRLGIVFSEEAAKNLPGYYEPLLLDSGELEVWPAVEEELILSLPIAATHPQGECSIETSFGETVETKQSDVPNPFQVLEQLKDSE